MARGKYVAKHTNSKVIAILLALVLMIGSVIGGTVAWLIANSDPVVNTFTYGDINIDLEETDTDLDDDDDPNTNEYEMLPGLEITKDPVVTVKAESEEMWLFVKLEKSSNFDTFMEYTVADGWTALTDVDGVYYRHITAEEVATADKEIQVIKDNTVTVKESVTKDMLNALDPEGETATYPTLTVTAYAVQYLGFEAEISEGAEKPTAEQENAAAQKAWDAAMMPATP